MLEQIMIADLTQPQSRALHDYSAGRLTAMELRHRLNEATYGEVLQLLREAQLPLPRASPTGREADLERARNWLFPKA